MKYKATLAIIALIILIAAVIIYQKRFANQEALRNSAAKQGQDKTAVNPAGSGQAGEMDSDDFNAQCEKGEWLTIADLSGDKITASGILKWVDTESNPSSQEFKDYTHYLDGKEKYGLIGKPTSDNFNALDMFQGREVEVEGILKSGSPNAIEVSRVHCTGNETDQSAIENRDKILNYISSNLNSFAPEKAKYQKWVPSSAMIVNDNNMYVEFYDTVEDEENSDINVDTSRRVLLEIEQASGNIKANVLAYYIMGNDDFTLKSGTDKFGNLDIDSLPSYSYDSEENSWTRD